ncbi:MAG: TerB family tellurite resistance protein [Hyphomicrobiales bacterium]|nr:TerB family tellurite resistance protein [Hyphomicrobiales bacterium]
MLTKLRKFLIKSDDSDTAEKKFDASDQQLAQAALMFHVIAADGRIHDEEKSKLRQVLQTRYGLSQSESNQLFEEAKRADREAIDLYTFTSILKRQLNEEERLELVENLWEMVFSDGEIHELEDNVVWRIAELLAIDKRDRMEMKRNVRRKMQTG